MLSLLSLSLLPAALIQATLTAAYRRALPNGPSGDYAPATVPCPAGLGVRAAGSGLSPNETAWLALRRNATVQPMIDFLARANLSGFDAQQYIDGVASGDFANLPNVAIAVSGGGYRALLNAAGFIAAADDRVAGTTTDPGGIGGLLQATTYLAGLSGGSWLVGSLFANGFAPVPDLQTSETVWQFDSSVFDGPPANDGPGDAGDALDTAAYWVEIAAQVAAKKTAGFPTSATDYWGRALSFQLVNATGGGPGFVYSGIADDNGTAGGFAQGQTPMPIIVADQRTPGATLPTGNSTVFEFTPFEMGSFDPTLAGFVPTAFLGSNFSAGDGGQCINGFDQLGFVFGTSSSLFNELLVANTSVTYGVPAPVASAIQAVSGGSSGGGGDADIARYSPNPFQGFNAPANPTADTGELDLVDGGEDLQNIPLVPLLQPARAVDVVFAVDSSADTEFDWPNGTSLVATAAHSQQSNGTLPFPAVPDVNTTVNLGLNSRPTFFGCDVSSFPAGQPPPPLLVYLPNAPYSTLSNVSTFDLSFAPAQRDAIILNGRDGATQSNGTLDGEWQTCVACAVLARSLARTGTEAPPACTACFARYCWNGTVDTQTPPPYQPGVQNGSSIGGSAPTSLGAKSAVAYYADSLWVWGVSVGLAVLLAS